MGNPSLSRKLTVLVPLAAVASLLAGCGTNVATNAATPIVKVSIPKLSGVVHGGQQPVSGSAIQLYAANTSGYGGASYALLNTTVLTDSGGYFVITGDYTCPSATSLVYLTATGGNPGLANGTNNANIAVLAALGPCGSLSSSTNISINELTTVAAAYALSPFMSSYAQLATSPTNTIGLANAFASANNLVDFSTGTLGGPTLPASAVLPTTQLNTLGNILASCVNTAGGSAGSSTPCGQLFTATTVNGVVPTDTVGAILSIAKNPSNNVASLLNLPSPASPFQPSTSTANSFLVSVKYRNIANPSAAAMNAAGNLWVTNASANTITVLSPTGSVTAGSPYSGAGLATPSAIAFDAAGNAWVTQQATSKLSVFSPSGTGTQTSLTGLSTPGGIAIDGDGLLWITNTGNNTVTSVNVTGTTINSSATYSGAGITAPVAIAINPN